MGQLEKNKLFLFLTIFISGVLLCFYAKIIILAIEHYLPLAMMVRSKGTSFPSFADSNGFVLQVRGIGISLALASFVMIIRDSFVSEFVKLRSSSPVFKVEFLLVSCFAILFFSLFSYLAYPPNAFTANSYYHWVENWFNIQMVSTYPLVRLTHYAFDGFPHLLQGLLAGTIFFLSYMIMRKQYGVWLGVLVAVSIPLYPFVMNFANISEDVLQNQCLLLLCLLVYPSRRDYFLGVIFVLAALGRFQFITIFGAFFVAEVAFHLDDVRPRAFWAAIGNVVTSRFFLTNIATGVIGFFLWVGLGYFGYGIISPIVNSLNTYNTLANMLSPKVVDGFTISKFSFTYLMHFVWMLPSSILLIYIIIFSTYKVLAKGERSVLVFISSFVLMNILVHDTAIGFYFNYRYLSYYMPILIIGGWLLKEAILRSGYNRFAIMLGVISLAAPFYYYNDSFMSKEKISSKPISELYKYREYLVGITKGEDVYTTLSNRSDNIYLAYIFRKPRRRFVNEPKVYTSKSLADIPDGKFFVANKSDRVVDYDIILDSGNYVVCRK